MKSIIQVLFTVILFCTANSSERCVPWPHTHDDPSQAQCWGYAACRAYGRTATDAVCSAMTASGNDIDLYYFYDVLAPDGIFDLSKLQEEDIVAWSDHAAYVVDIQNPTNIYYIYLMQRRGPIYPEETISLGDEMGRHNNNYPTHIYRKKKSLTYYVENTFGNQSHGGCIEVNSDPDIPSGSLTPGQYWESRQYLVAIEHNSSVDGYIQLFHEWRKNSVHESYKQDYNFLIVWQYNPYPPTFEAVFKNQLNIQFHNHFFGVEYHGKLKVNGTTYNDIEVANPFKIKDSTSISFEAINQTYNNIIYTFHHWQEDQSTQRSRTEYPRTHKIYTAYFTGKPTPITGFTWTCNTGDPISFSWSQHPNASVKYRIYRKTRDQYGHTTGPTLLTTKNHDQTTFTDNMYVKASTYIYLVSYDVRAYYTVEQTEAASYYRSVYGDVGLAKNAEESTPLLTENSSEFQLHNFPNPFNPVTNIVFSLPEASTLKLTIYNSTGQQVKTLVNGFFPAGSHVLSWNGTNDQDVRVSSGVYFLIIELPSAVYKRKLVLLK